MGGYGSGQWRGYVAQTVESARWLDVNRWRREGIIRSSCTARGLWQWSSAATGAVLASIGYYAEAAGPAPYVLLIYNAAEVPIRQRVALTTTRPQLGGMRYWFVCPACDRRVARLYLAGASARFACRTCRGLTYTSCQESHRWDALGRQMGFDAGVWRRLQRSYGM